MPRARGLRGYPRSFCGAVQCFAWATVFAFLALTAGAGSARAGVMFVGGFGATVYGVSPLDGPRLNPVFISNNVTGFNDILASPGGGYLLANPVVGNNIAQFGPQALPLPSFMNGGGNNNGTFGSGATTISGPQIGFRLSDLDLDPVPAASYSISSWTTNFRVTPGGFIGNLGTFLSVGGTLVPAAGGGSVGVAALVSHYSFNGGPVMTTPPLILAAAGNGRKVAMGGNGAAVQYGVGFSSFRGLAIDLVPATLLAGTTIQVVSTLTEFADPATMDSIAADLSLLPPGSMLPDFAFAGTSPLAAAEPGSWLLLATGLVGLLRYNRRQKKRAS